MQEFETLTGRGQLQRLRRMARAALARYGLEGAHLTTLAHEHNTTFRVMAEDGARYVLRIHRPAQHTPEVIRSELLWLQALRQQTGLGVPDPVAAGDGSLLVRVAVAGVPEPRDCVLFRWVDGRFLDGSLRPVHLGRVGRLAAGLHDHSAGWPRPDGFVRSRVDHLMAGTRRTRMYDPDDGGVNPGEADAAAALALVRATCSEGDVATVERTIDRMRALDAALGRGPEVFGLIHADLHQWNYLFHGEEARAIDFDDCGWGHYLYDLAVTLLEVGGRPESPALRDALLGAYRAERPLPAEHEPHLPTLFAYRRLQLLLWILESREHPAFRDDWRTWIRKELERMAIDLAT